MKGLGTGGWGLVVVALTLLASGPAKAGHYRNTVASPVVSGFSRTIASPRRTADDAAVRKQLAGEWTLVKYEIFGENGQTRPGNYDIGRINYGEREMSAHLMRSGRPKESPATEAARAAAYQGYLGYFGPYTIDAEKQIVVHHVAGSSLPNWLGSEQVRHYAFSADGKQLTLSLKSTRELFSAQLISRCAVSPTL